jgi:uncharacterized membrane protein
MAAFSDISQTLFMWAIVYLVPLLVLFLKKPAWAKVFCYIFLYPLVIMYVSKQSHFHLNPALVFAAALLSLGVAALLLVNPTIRERVSDPSDSRITGPAYFAGISGLFLFLIFLSGVVPNSPIGFYPSETTQVFSNYSQSSEF